jgi:hypothetical protein
MRCEIQFFYNDLPLLNSVHSQNIMAEIQTQEQRREISEYPSDEQHSRNISGLQDGNLNDSTTLDNLVGKNLPQYENRFTVRYCYSEIVASQVSLSLYHFCKSKLHKTPCVLGPSVRNLRSYDLCPSFMELSQPPYLLFFFQR